LDATGHGEEDRLIFVLLDPQGEAICEPVQFDSMLRCFSMGWSGSEFLVVWSEGFYDDTLIASRIAPVL